MHMCAFVAALPVIRIHLFSEVIPSKSDVLILLDLVEACVRDLLLAL